MLPYSFIKDKQDIGRMVMYLDNERKGAIVPLFIQVEWIGCWRAKVNHITRNEKREKWFKFPRAAMLTVQQTASLH